MFVRRPIWRHTSPADRLWWERCGTDSPRGMLPQRLGVEAGRAV